LENPETNLASVIYTSDIELIGKYYQENRTNSKYNELSDWLIKALVSTEDERYYEHSGIDVKALGRVVKGVVTGNSSQGGGSTISQQLSKLLFPREKLSKIELVVRKFKEWIIAARLEKNYTKAEIISMYFNKFDFLNNAVGVNSAASVYFGKTPLQLNIQESAMLVGMAKNPSLFNPLRFPEKVIKRREIVLFQMKKNGHLKQQEYDSIRELPLGLNYTRVDHQTGLAPYFRETLRAELTKIFRAKNEQGVLKLKKSNGTPYDLYSDGLKVYTTIDSRIQKHAEYAVSQHLKHELQEDFNNNNSKWTRTPFSNDLEKQQVDTIIARALRQSKIFKKYSGKICGYCERPKKYIQRTDTGYVCSYCEHVTSFLTKKQIDSVLNKKRIIKVFDWESPNYEKDTLMSSRDSVYYYKGLLRASLMSMDPKNGQVKAWVGGPYFKHFKYDMVKKGRRQVGSTFKPFVYATAIEIGALHPCDQIPDIEHCVEVPYNEYRNKLWCPSNAGQGYSGALTPVFFALASSMNNITASIIKKNGMMKEVFGRIAQLGMDTSKFIAVPSMALGVFDLSVYEMVGAISSFANGGVYIEPTFISKIEDKYGNIIYEPERTAKQVWNAETAFTMLEMMKLVTTGVRHPTLKNKFKRPLVGGTAIRIRSRDTAKRPYVGITQPVAGKTGTTQNQSDGWFMGVTPDLVTGVWVGAEDRSVRFRTVNMGMGTNTALPIWAYMTKEINKDSTLNLSQEDFEKPLNLLSSPLDCESYKAEKSVFDNLQQQDGLKIWGQEEEDIW
jgi:penicillin-binding protein 1A